MKKNIEVLSADSPLLLWLMDKLKAAPPELKKAEEWVQGIKNMLSGASSSLLVDWEGTDAPAPADEELHCGELTIQAGSRRVSRGGQEISLTPKEYDILYFLASNRGEVYNKEQIYHAVWDGDYLLDDSNITAFIRKLRKKIEPNPDEPEYILTIWGVGYKFNDKL